MNQEQLVQAFATALKAAGSTPTGAPGHGLGGTFSYPGRPDGVQCDAVASFGVTACAAVGGLQ